MAIGPFPNKDLGAVLTLTNQANGTVTTPANLPCQQHTGCKVVVNISSITGTSPTLTVTLQGVDVASGAVYTILASSALSATGTTVLTVYPGIAVTGNKSVSDCLPIQWNIKAVVAGTGPSVTATISAILLR